MEIIKIVSFAFIVLFLFLLFKDKRSDIAVLIILAAGAIMFLFLANELTSIISFFREIADKANIDIVYIGIVLKILAIAYLSTFCAEICRDAGSSSLANKVELAGKVLILGLSVPILMAVLNSILKIM